jgi:hypothetical protein
MSSKKNMTHEEYQLSLIKKLVIACKDYQDIESKYYEALLAVLNKISYILHQLDDTYYKFVENDISTIKYIQHRYPEMQDYINDKDFAKWVFEEERLKDKLDFEVKNILDKVYEILFTMCDIVISTYKS